MWTETQSLDLPVTSDVINYIWEMGINAKHLWMEMCKKCIKMWFRFGLCMNLHPPLVCSQPDFVIDRARRGLPWPVCFNRVATGDGRVPNREHGLPVWEKDMLYIILTLVVSFRSMNIAAPALVSAEQRTFLFISSFHRHRNSWLFWQFVSLSRIWCSLCW